MTDAAVNDLDPSWTTPIPDLPADVLPRCPTTTTTRAGDQP